MEDRGNAVGLPGFSKDQEVDLVTMLMGVSEAPRVERGVVWHPGSTRKAQKAFTPRVVCKQPTLSNEDKTEDKCKQ
eukprot:2974733-Amphidinium_carterae.1